MEVWRCAFCGHWWTYDDGDTPLIADLEEGPITVNAVPFIANYCEQCRPRPWPARPRS